MEERTESIRVPLLREPGPGRRKCGQNENENKLGWVDVKGIPVLTSTVVVTDGLAVFVGFELGVGEDVAPGALLAGDLAFEAAENGDLADVAGCEV